MRCAAIQMRSGIAITDNISTMRQLVHAAASDGARYIQTPEMTGLLQKNKNLLMSHIYHDADDPVFEAAADLSKQFNIWLHIGSTPIKRPDGKIANRAALFSPKGDRVAFYDKIHMFDVDLGNGETWRESTIYAPGNISLVTNIEDIKLGLAICYDIRFPDIFRQQALAGAHVITAPAAFTRPTGEAHWHILMRARAIENGAYMIAAAQGGVHEDGRETYGHSVIIDPWGKVIAHKADDEPGYILADVDILKSQQVRSQIPNLKNIRPFSLNTSGQVK